MTILISGKNPAECPREYPTGHAQGCSDGTGNNKKPPKFYKLGSIVKGVRNARNQHVWFKNVCQKIQDTRNKECSNKGTFYQRPKNVFGESRHSAS